MSRLGVPSRNYVRADEVWQYIHKNPGVTARQITRYFYSDVSRTLSRLLEQGKLTRTKQDVWRWYARKEVTLRAKPNLEEKGGE